MQQFLKATAFLFITAQLSVAVTTTTLTYRETTGKTVRTSATVITQTDDSTIVESKSPVFTIRHVLEKNYQSRSWHAQSTEDKFEMTARKDGADIVASGTLKNKPISKRTKPEKKIWYQELTMPLGAWARVGEKTTKFWMVMVFNGELFEFAAHNDGATNVVVDGTSTDCIHVRMTLAGAMAILWKGDYFFRTSDGRLIKYEGATRPGAQKMMYELIKEE